jgi:hypothetical protein
MGKGAKVVLDMFGALPPWVQTAVLTGWGLNKLTGGALGNIAGSLIGGMRGGTPANPMFTREVGPGGGGGGGGGLGAALLGGAAAGLTVAGGVSALGSVSSNNAERQNAAVLTLMGGFPSMIGRALSEALGLAQPVDVEDRRAISAAERGAAAARDAVPWMSRIAAETSETSRMTSNVSTAVRGQSGLLAQIRDRPTRVNVNVSVPVSINNWSRVQTSKQYSYSSLDRGI